jgi:hypothetical protein
MKLKEYLLLLWIKLMRMFLTDSVFLRLKEDRVSIICRKI